MRHACMFLMVVLMLDVVGEPFGGAKWIGSNPALAPEIDFSQARWVTGERVRVEVGVRPGDSRELVLVAKSPFSLRVNGTAVYEWKGHVFRPEVLRHFNLTPYLDQGDNVVAIEKAESVLAVVRNGTNIVSSSSGAWHGVDAELGKGPSFAGLIDFREELESPAFAKRFVVREGLCSAKLNVTGLGFYEALVDGVKIGENVLDPSPTDYAKRVLYSTFELGNLKPGEHSLTILLGHGWYDMRSTATWNFDNAPWRSRPKAIASLEFGYSDGSRECIVTDDSWEQVESPVAYDCIREGEIDDARRLLGRRIGFNAVEVAAPQGALEPMRHPAARVVERLAPRNIKDLGDGRFLVTFPRTVSGWVRATFRGLSSGDVVALRYDENLGPDGGPALDSRDNWDVAHLNGRRTVDVYFQQSGSGRILPRGSSFQTDHFISAGGAEETFEPRFAYHGFRHVLVTGLKVPLEAKDIVACRVMTDFAATGSFECSDALLTELVEMTRNSYMANFADGLPTDCPHREKLAWTGDGWIASEFGLGFFDSASSYRKWMRDIFDTMRPSGEVCCIAPTSGWGYKWGNGPVFDAAVAMIAWNLWLFRGDRAALEEAYPYLVRYLAYEKTRETEPGLVANGLGDWNAVEPSHKPSDEYVISCIYLMLQDTAGKMADVLGYGRDREKLEESARQTRDALRRKYCRGGGVFDNGGQTAQALAVTLHLAENPTDARAVADRLVHSVVETGCHVDFGLVGAKFVFRGLTEIGRADLAHRMIVNPTEPSMVKWTGKNGTLWEDLGFGSSKCHIMLGDFAAWAQQTIAGIRRPAKPGYSEVVVEPVPVSGLDWAKGSVMTPRGKLSVSWAVIDGEFSIEVKVPPETHAEVRLPDGGRNAVGEGRHVFKARVGSNETSKHEGDRASFGPLSPSARPCERQYLWPEGSMPDFQAEQVAAKWDCVTKPGFDRAANLAPFIEWYVPSGSNRTDICMLTVSGGSFCMTCDAERLQPAIDRLVAAGITVADVTYRTPRPTGLPIHQTAWEDVQRAVRIVRNEAKKRGYSPDKIGATGISAGAKAVLLVATSSLTRAYEPVDEIDAIPANLDFAVLQAAAYVLSDGATGPNERCGDGEGIVIVPELRFDEKTCPMCFLHGGADAFSPLGSTRVFRKLREMGIPADLHIFESRWHGFHGDQNIGETGEAYDHWWDRAMDFILPLTDGEPFPPEVPEGLILCEAGSPKAVEAIERWENLWRKGIQTNLHIAGSRGPVVWSGRIREFLNSPHH